MKIGIITMYYNSDNYGGNLQAYALAQYLNQLSYSTEQICYSLHRPSLLSKTFRNYKLIKQLKGVLWAAIRRVQLIRYVLAGGIICYYRIKKREKKIYEFGRMKIKHSDDIYYAFNYKNMGKHYDVFITGSDQVWNTSYGVVPAYFLDGILAPKIKLSYAASLGKSNWTEAELEVHHKYLADFDAISVREEDAVQILSNVVSVPVEWVVDPTLLLARQDWDKLCAPRMVDEPYLFCYFLGMDVEERELAKTYAKALGLKLVNMPFLLKEMLLNKDFRQYEAKFGDEKLYDVSPEDFLSLIKHATCVFTDSFHAALFSGVFQREYFIFGRGEMNSRITSLTKLYETEERFCNTPEKRTMEYIQAQKPIDYTRDLKFLEEMRQKSKDFLRTNLEKAERQINGI